MTELHNLSQVSIESWSTSSRDEDEPDNDIDDVETNHGCCFRAVTRGFDRRVLDVVNAWSLADFVWESFSWVRCTGFTDGGFYMGSIPGSVYW